MIFVRLPQKGSNTQMTTATFSTSPSDILELENASYTTDRKLVGAAVGTGILAASLAALPVHAETTKAALKMVADLDTIAVAAFAVCLTPFAAMTTLKFLNMVLGRV